MEGNMLSREEFYKRCVAEVFQEQYKESMKEQMLQRLGSHLMIDMNILQHQMIMSKVQLSLLEMYERALYTGRRIR
jgi:hypothetical protein